MVMTLKAREAPRGQWISASDDNVEITFGSTRETHENCVHMGLVIDGESFPPKAGFGDYAENLFSAIRITKERFSSLFASEKEAIGGENCGCNWRHKVLNSISAKLGWGPGRGPELNKVVEIQDLPTLPIRACDVHGKCVVRFRPTDDGMRAAIKETTGSQCCPGCRDFQDKLSGTVTVSI